LSFHQSPEEIKNELAIIAKAKTDPNRFSALYEKYYKQIFLFVYRRIDDEDLSADLTSQVFLKAILNLPKYQYKGVPFSAWLYRIASNEVNQHFRETKLTRVISIEEDGLSRLVGELREETEERDQEDIIMASLNYLTKEEVQYLELRFFENKSFREIGYILLITENNAKVKTYRIIDKIKKMIREKKNEQL
jgi:RNA polymerase sigma-70 factor, ECF subfamily